MKVGIVTIPNKRDMYLYPLIDVLEKSGCEVKLFVDYKRKGHAWNLQQTLEGMLDDAEKDEPVLITMDDVITDVNWINDWNNIYKRPRIAHRHYYCCMLNYYCHRICNSKTRL